MKFDNKLIILKNKYTLKYDNFYFKCSVGKKGLTSKKKEGDGRTPKGIYKLGILYYRKDRVKKPITSLKCRPLKKKMGWCNNPRDKKNYNKLINITKIHKAEKLFRNDYKYNYFITILYNTKKRTLKKGSAIFIHLTKRYSVTAGCIALIEKDFLILARLINKNTKIKIS